MAATFAHLQEREMAGDPGWQNLRNLREEFERLAQDEKKADARNRLRAHGSYENRQATYGECSSQEVAMKLWRRASMPWPLRLLLRRDWKPIALSGSTRFAAVCKKSAASCFLRRKACIG